MLSSQINQSHSFRNISPLHKPFLATDATRHSSSSAYSPAILRQPTTTKKSNNATRARRTSAGTIKATKISFSTSTKVSGTIDTKLTYLFNLTPSQVIDDVTSFMRSSLVLTFVSKDLDPNGNLKTLKTKAKYEWAGRYNFQFEVPEDFGEIGDIGAVLVENDYRNAIYIEKIEVSKTVTFTCNSWVPSNNDNSEGRIFFTDKSYLPSQTPEALKSLRAKDLESFRGDGTGERKPFDRIYDYDVYNDLGSPDESSDLSRPVLGGQRHPYPRRCRTGRKMSSQDPSTETRVSFPTAFYVPIDEDFSEIKTLTFGPALYNALHVRYLNEEEDFLLFREVDSLFDEGVIVQGIEHGSVMPRFVQKIEGATEALIKFDPPETTRRDTFFWLRDEEFCRQMLAGVNPCCIQLVTEWPLKSKLDASESGITKEIVEREIKGTLEEALAQKKLFILDYHDLLLPFVNKIRELDGTTLYGSRTLMFLTPAGTLTPVAIELTRPPSELKVQWKHVYTPSSGATDSWLWKLAKAHVLAHDSGYHQLVTHWLRTHCATEPYIIATHRRLSQMHPIARLLHPHFRNTMKINSLARQYLINAGGLIESSFSPLKYSMQLCSDVYDKLWRFDLEALPRNLVHRGMAVKDDNAPQGVKLTIEDYPYANDGLLIWDAIMKWVVDYVDHYYPEDALVESDEELQAWWNEIRTVGHGDKKEKE